MSGGDLIVLILVVWVAYDGIVRHIDQRAEEERQRDEVRRITGK